MRAIPETRIRAYADDLGNAGFSHSGAALQDAASKAFYVATNGNDKWSGTLPNPSPSGNDGPFATLQQARNAIRSIRKSGVKEAYTVLVRGGQYKLNQTLVFEPQDSGTESSPVTFKAFGHERPILSGGAEITDFEPFKGKVFKASIAPLKAALPVRQLFDHGKRQILARFPDFNPNDPVAGGFLYVDKATPTGSKNQFKYQENSVHDWAVTSDADVVIFPGLNYTNNTLAGFHIDAASRTIELATAATHEIKAFNRFYFQNLFDELNSPGEWFFDRKNNNLYYWPAEGVHPDAVTIPLLKTIVEIRSKGTGNVSKGATANIRFEGFDLEGAQGNAITVSDSRNVLIAANRIYNVGGHGIEIQNGFNNVAFGNDIYEVGGAGIKINGGDRKTLTPASHRAENNYIHHIGRIVKNSSGIDCRGVGNTVSHNLIHSTPRIGIWHDGNDHLIEYNHIHDTNQETEDSGMIYSSQIDWTKRGTVIQYNYLHDSGGYGRNTTTGEWQSPFRTYGIYLDDWTSGTKVFGNIVANTANGGIFIHSGRDNIIENNIIHEGGQLGQMVYSAWLPDKPEARRWLPKMVERLQEMRYTKYSGLSNIKDIKSGASMSGNSFLHNIVHYSGQGKVLYGIFNDFDYATTASDYNVIHHGGLPLLIPYTKAPNDRQWAVWKDLKMDTHSVIADPMIAGARMGDFALSSASPAFKLGFKPIPQDKIGPYRDSLRASWPINE